MPLVQAAPPVGTGNADSVTCTFSANTAAGNCLYVFVGWQTTGAATTISGVTIGGSASNFSQVVAITQSNGPNGAIWKCPNCPGGQTVVTASFTPAGGTGSPVIEAWEFSGMGTSVTDATGSGSGTGTAWTATGTPNPTTSPAEVWIGGAYTLATSITGPGAPWSNTAQFGSSVAAIAGEQVTSSTGAATYSGTITLSRKWATVVATFVVPAAPVTVPGLSLRGRAARQVHRITTAPRVPPLPPPVQRAVTARGHPPAQVHRITTGPLRPAQAAPPPTPPVLPGVRLRGRPAAIPPRRIQAAGPAPVPPPPPLVFLPGLRVRGRPAAVPPARLTRIPVIPSPPARGAVLFAPGGDRLKPWGKPRWCDPLPFWEDSPDVPPCPEAPPPGPTQRPADLSPGRGTPGLMAGAWRRAARKIDGTPVLDNPEIAGGIAYWAAQRQHRRDRKRRGKDT